MLNNSQPDVYTLFNRNVNGDPGGFCACALAYSRHVLNTSLLDLTHMLPVDSSSKLQQLSFTAAVH